MGRKRKSTEPETAPETEPAEKPLSNEERAELERLRQENQTLRTAKAKAVRPSGKVKPISNEEVASLSREVARLISERDRCVDLAVRRKGEGRLDESEELRDKAEVLDRQAVAPAAKLACVKPSDIMHKTRRGGEGEEIAHGHAIGFRNGLVRIVLVDGRRLKVDARDVDRAAWDYVHDKPGFKGRVANTTPGGWKGRKRLNTIR